MKTHSNILTRENFRAAEKRADVKIVELEQTGSRSRQRAFRFYLSGSTGRPGNQRDEQAATWDEWGIFFAELFDADPAAHCTKNSYLSAEHFHWVTGDRFRTLTPLLQHNRHKWEPLAALPGGFAEARERGWAEAKCDCGAVNRWLLPPKKWEDIAA